MVFGVATPVEHPLAGRRACHHRLVGEDAPHRRLARVGAAGFGRGGVDDPRVLRPRADAAVRRHLRRPHVVAARVVAQHGAAPRRGILPRVDGAVAAVARRRAEAQRLAAVAEIRRTTR